MSESYIGEIQAFAFNIPQGFRGSSTWMPCNGQLIPIQQNTALFSLIGTYYGGNGTSNFALPNLNSGVVVGGVGAGPGLTERSLAERVGTSTETLTQQEMAAHTHTLALGPFNAVGATAGPGANGATYLANPSFSGFAITSPTTNLAITAMYSKGGSQAHENMQPAVAMTWYIAIDGIFPSFNN